MAVTVSGTQITFNDGTVQTTAGGTPSAGGVGSTQVFWMTRNANFYAGGTISGSYLFTLTAFSAPGGQFSWPTWFSTFDATQVSSIDRTTAFTITGSGGAYMTLSPASGTWRFVAPAQANADGGLKSVVAIRTA